MAKWVSKNWLLWVGIIADGRRHQDWCHLEDGIQDLDNMCDPTVSPLELSSPSKWLFMAYEWELHQPVIYLTGMINQAVSL